jgi:hypothetical protein
MMVLTAIGFWRKPDFSLIILMLVQRMEVTVNTV